VDFSVLEYVWHQLTTLTPMTRNLLFIGLLFIAQFSFAQGARKSGIETKSIEIEKVNGTTQVTITTNKNGDETIEVYTGNQAEEWLKENEAESSSNKTTVSVHIDQDDVEEMKQEIIEVQDDIARELDRVAAKIGNINLDSILNSFDIEVHTTDDGVAYELNINGDQKRSVIIMKSFDDSEDGVDVNVDVEVEIDEDHTTESVRVTRRAFLVEDDAKKKSSLKLKDLSIYPNPADQVLKVGFVSNSTDQIIVTLKNSQGSLVSTMKTSGKGQKNLAMDLNDLAAGVYYLNIAQGNDTLNKKLIIQ
jgi:hypothetical protein